MKLLAVPTLMAVLSIFSATAASQVTPPKEGIKPSTIVKPTNPITGEWATANLS
jgi:hypothetical protein